MSIRTLIRDKMNSLDIIVEKSDSGKLFFGATREKTSSVECVTFDLKSNHDNKMVNIVRDSVFKFENGAEGFVSIEIDISHERRTIVYSTKTHKGEDDRPALEIRRAYNVVKMYLNHLGSDKKKVKLYEELMEYLRVAYRHEEGFQDSYTVLER